MSKSRIFLFVLLNFIVGVFVRSFFEIDKNYLFLLLLFSLVFLFTFYKNKLAALAAFILLSFNFGLWVANDAIEKANQLVYAGKVFQENTIVQKATSTSFGQNLIVQSAKEKILLLLQVPQYPQYAYGDLLNVSCVVGPIENLDASFDYRMYMAKEGVLYQCDKSKIKKVGENAGNFLYAKILEIRSAFENKIIKVIHMPEGALADGLLFGGGSGLSKEIQTDFSVTGMTHIVAVSGYNVTIIAEYLMMIGIFLGLWRKHAVWFAIIGIILFVVMSGLPASAVRAGVMSGILLWAMKNGRLASSENAIIFAGAFMLFLNPLLLRWDVGFQLSFLATLGIVLTASFWEKSFAKKHKALGISEAITLSLSAQIFVLPIIVYNFHLVSLISLLANIFILPIIPLSMLLVFLVVVFGFIFWPLSLVFGWLAYFTLVYEIKLIHTLAIFPFSSLQVERISQWWILLYYCILIMLIYFVKKRECEIIEN